MARITVEDCLENVDNRFKLVLLATKRARQLSMTHAEPLLSVDGDKNTVIALREIASDLIDDSVFEETHEREHEQVHEFGPAVFGHEVHGGRDHGTTTLSTAPVLQPTSGLEYGRRESQGNAPIFQSTATNRPATFTTDIPVSASQTTLSTAKPQSDDAGSGSGDAAASNGEPNAE